MPPQPLRQTERSEEILSASDRINRLRRVRLVINRDIVNPGSISEAAAPTYSNLMPFAAAEPEIPPLGALQPPQLPWHYSVVQNGSSFVGPVSRCRRLTHYIAEPNVGRGYIKELAFGVGGRVIASPFGYGVRLLSFDPDCSEVCDRPADFAAAPIQLHEVVTNICHGSVVVSTKFSPDSSLLVTGSLGGKVGFHHPRW